MENNLCSSVVLNKLVRWNSLHRVISFRRPPLLSSEDCMWWDCI